MKTQVNEDGTIEVFLRQSWLTTARDCMEKARFDLTAPRISTDFAAIGTAVHAGAELGCTNPDAGEFDIVEAASREWRDICASGDIRFVKHDVGSGLLEVQRLARSWNTNLRKHVTSPRFVEDKFTAAFDIFELNGQTIIVNLEGTMDLVQFDSLWDWKTSSKKYSWRDKQQESIQASVYAAAAVALGWLEYPVKFNFGVLIRGTNDSQVVSVTRDKSHEKWLRQQARQMVVAALTIGTANQWPTNDTGALCSPVWCDHWTTCKGEHLAYIDYPRRGQ